MNAKWCLKHRLHYLRATISRALGPVLVIVLFVAMAQLAAGLDTSVGLFLAISAALLAVLIGEPSEPSPARYQAGV